MFDWKEATWPNAVVASPPDVNVLSTWTTVCSDLDFLRLPIQLKVGCQSLDRASDGSSSGPSLLRAVKFESVADEDKQSASEDVIDRLAIFTLFPL